MFVFQLKSIVLFKKKTKKRLGTKQIFPHQIFHVMPYAEDTWPPQASNDHPHTYTHRKYPAESEPSASTKTSSHILPIHPEGFRTSYVTLSVPASLPPSSLIMAPLTFSGTPFHTLMGLG